MRARVCSIGLSMLLLQTALVAGQAQPQWKLDKGEKFFLEEKSVAKYTIKVAGTAIDQELSSIKLSQIVVKSHTRDSIVLEQAIEAFSSKMAVMGNAVDGTSDLAGLLNNVVFTLQLSPEGKVTQVQGYEQFVKNVDAASATAGDEQKALEWKALKAVLTEQGISSGVSQLFSVLPAGLVKKGESWKREQVVSLGPLGTFRLNLNLNYKGPAGDTLEKIEATGELTYEAPKGDSGDLGFRVVKLDLTQKKVAGHLLFDKKLGRLASQELNAALAGSMVIEVGGMQSQVDLEGTEKRTVRVLDQKP